MTTRGRRPVDDKEDPWGLDSGLPDDVDITISKSVFGYLDTYQNGEVALLIWDVDSPDADFEYPIIWPCGSGWEVKERGKRVEHPKRSRFVETSTIGRLIKRCKELGIEDTLRARGNPRDASIWEGLTFHVKRERTEIPGGKERGLPEFQDHLMPTEFVESEAPAPARTAPSTAAGPRPSGRTTSRTAPRTATRAQEPEPSVDALTERLTSLAKTLELEKFQKAAMNIDEMNDPANSALLAEVLEDGEEGFWAKARA